jgi:hypothetical protein
MVKNSYLTQLCTRRNRKFLSVILSIILLTELVLILPSQTYGASYSARNEAGLGQTNNAYLSDSNQQSDVYWKITSNNIWREPKKQYSLRVSYRDYNKINENDLFTWRAGQDWITRFLPNGWVVKAAVFGNHYLRNSPGTTDESFSHLGAQIRGEKKVKLNSTTELSWGPGAEERRYLDRSLRSDHTILVYGEIENEATSALVLAALAEIGLTISSQADFNRLYLDLSGSADYNINRDWLWSSEVSLRGTRFMDRTIGEETATTKARGRQIKDTRASGRESYTTLSLLTGVVRSWSSHWRSGLSVNLDTQQSASGLQNYSEFGVYAKMIWIP